MKKTNFLLILLSFSVFAAGQVNMDRYITLTVENGAEIGLAFNSATAGTPVKIVSGSATYDLTVEPVSSYTVAPYVSGDVTMTIYGDITGFECINNNSKVTGIDLSKNLDLNHLNVRRNRLTVLDISGMEKLGYLNAYGNYVLAGNKLITGGNTALRTFNVSGNELSGFIDFREMPDVQSISLQENKFDACTLDSIFLSLPDRTEVDGDFLVRIKDSQWNTTNPGAETCRTEIAYMKNWRVVDNNGSADIFNPAPTCEAITLPTGNNLVKYSEKVTLYPNPVKDIVTIQSENKINKITLLDTYGRAVKQISAEGNQSVLLNVESLSSGIYFLKVDSDKGMGVQKLVKN